MSEMRSYKVGNEPIQGVQVPDNEPSRNLFWLPTGIGEHHYYDPEMRGTEVQYTPAVLGHQLKQGDRVLDFNGEAWLVISDPIVNSSEDIGTQYEMEDEYGHVRVVCYYPGQLVVLHV